MQEIGVLLISILLGILLAEFTEWRHTLSVNTAKNETMKIKQQLGQILLQRFTNSPENLVVGFQITTIKGWLETIQFLFELVSKDSVELIDGVTLKLGTV